MRSVLFKSKLPKLPVILSLEIDSASIVELITILLLKALQKQAKHPWHLSNLIAFIRLNLFVKINLHDWLNKPFIDDNPDIELHQLQLF